MCHRIQIIAVVEPSQPAGHGVEIEDWLMYLLAVCIISNMHEYCEMIIII